MAAAPVIRVVNPGAPVSRQQAVLVATKEARRYRDKEYRFAKPPPELLLKGTALDCAKRLLAREEIREPSRQLCLGRLVLPFGQYENAPFHWLVENDVGYLKYLVDKHTAECRNLAKKGELANQWIKDFLREYAECFPQISNLLEANIDHCIYGQKGFEDSTFEEMWELYSQFASQKAVPTNFSEEERKRIQAAYTSVRRWLNTPQTHIASVQMRSFRKYINEREKQLHGTTKASQRPAASWSGDTASDSELLAACQSMEDSLQSNVAVTKQPDTVRHKKSEPPAPSTVQPSAPLLLQQPPPSIVRPPSPVVPRVTETTQPAKKPSSSISPKPSSRPAKTTLSTSQPPSLPSDTTVELEGWVRLWENPSGIPPADITWLKEDTERGLFTPAQTYKDHTGALKRRRLMKSDRMWFHPPEAPGYIGGALPNPGAFFRSRVYMWRPVGVWRYSLKYPRGDQCVGKGGNVYLYKSGYHTRVRQICDIAGWYTLMTEVLCCGPCTKAARNKEGGTVGRWLAWDSAILSQLSEAHQAMFPAVLTSKRGVDKNVVRLLRDRTEGNTMTKVYRQIQENHVEEYLHRKDLYTTLLLSLSSKGGIVPALGHNFQAPPPQRELPSARLLRHAFLLAEAENVQDYRSQVLSTFGTVLKMDSTKKVVKKLSGEGNRSAEWFTSIGNELSQIVTFVLTCEESVEKLKPMCRGVMERFKLANQPAPRILYVDRGCCHSQGATATETLFQPWVDSGMVIRLDIFHWIHRFDAAIRTESHSKYADFKSALAGAVMAYNRDDLELLISAVRAKDPASMNSLTDKEVLRNHISKEQLKHYVRRVTQGAQETFRLIQEAIEELKGPAGLDESGVSLFKTPDAIDQLWAAQQCHLECIQDPPGMSMYRVAWTATIKKVDVPYYKSLRGTNSLEGFHRALPHMIPGPHCAARPYQVYLISGIARWNSDRSSAAVFGGRGRRYKSYSAPLIDRLNTRCQLLFGETVEENFRPPAELDSTELLGLEYLFSQSTGESFSLNDIVSDGPGEEEEVIQPDQSDPDEAYQSDLEESQDTTLDAAARHITLTSCDTANIQPPAFQDVCSLNPLPGFDKLERFCAALVDLAQSEKKLSLTTEQRSNIIALWNAVEEHDKLPQKFNQLYREHWGNTLYCRTKRESLVDAAVVQKLKMAKRYAPAQQDISVEHNRLMYTLVKLLWLRTPRGSHSSPEKASLLKTYERIQHMILVDDAVLCKAGIPLPKINSKTVREFIRRQERLLNLHATKQPDITTKTSSISATVLPPAPHQPAVLPPPDYPVKQFVPTPSTAGTKLLKGRKDMALTLPLQPVVPLLPPASSPQPTGILHPLAPAPVRERPAPSTSTCATQPPAAATETQRAYWARATK